jgi:uncharacterized membrane protein YheB (UPF0754 family)
MQEFFGNIWFQLSTIVVVATIHGYGAAWLAVRMLFRPYRAIKIFGVTIFPQGMIPRHRDRMATAIGNAVGNELVSQETIVNALFGEKQFLRNKVEGLVNSYAADLLNQDFPSLLEALPTGIREIFLDSVSSVQIKLGNYVVSTLKSETTAEAVREFVDKQADKLLARRVSETLDEETFMQALGFVETRVRDILHERAVAQRINDFVSARVDDVANTQTSLGEMFTPEFVSFFRERVSAQIQPIVHELAQIATSNRTKTQIASLIKTEIGDYYKQLPFYQKMFVSRDRLFREVDDLVNTTLPRKIEETLRGEVFAAEAENFLNSTIDTWLVKPLPELVGQIAPEKLESLKEQIAGTLLKLVQSGEMQQSLSAYLTDTLQKIRPHSWRAIAERIHPEAAPRLKKAVTGSLLVVLQRDETAGKINRILTAQIERLLDTPIGKLSQHLSAETVTGISDSITDRIISAAEERLPIVIKEFDIGTLVREKVDAYPLEKLENLVLSIAGQHLRKIELFGLFIGFFIGVFQAFYFWVFARH